MIECENVCLTYRKKTILQGASLTARPGQITALLGKTAAENLRWRAALRVRATTARAPSC